MDLCVDPPSFVLTFTTEPWQNLPRCAASLAARPSVTGGPGSLPPGCHAPVLATPVD